MSISPSIACPSYTGKQQQIRHRATLAVEAGLGRHARLLPPAQAGQLRPPRSGALCHRRCRRLFPRRCAGLPRQPALNRLVSKPGDGAAGGHGRHPGAQAAGEPPKALLSVQLAADLHTGLGVGDGGWGLWR